MRRLVTRGLLLALLALPGGPAGAQSPSPYGGPDGGPPLEPVPAGPAGHFRIWSGESRGVPGRVEYRAHEAIVVDHPFDDHGANTDLSDGRNLGPGEYDTLLAGANAAAGMAGDYRYPDDPVYGRNAADIVEVRLAADEEAWYLLVVLNTLVDPERTAVEARIAGHRLLVHGQTADLDGVTVPAVADAEQNLFEARVPRAVFDPGEATHRVFVAAGLWDPARGDWLRPDPVRPPYFDLAYVPDEGMDSYWRDKEQAADIASGDFEDDAFPVDFRLLLGRCPRCLGAEPAEQGFFTRVFRSGQPLGEGVTLQTRYGQQGSGFGWNVYRSRYQPYAIYLPEDPPAGPRPLVLLLHFLSGNHMSYPLVAAQGIRTWAERLGAIVAMPLARGEAGWYEGEAEKDVFEVWRDVALHYPVDRERVYLAGMSMGGFGAWRLGHLYPDQFAKAIVWSGPLTPYSIWVAPAPLVAPYPNPPACDRDAPGCGYNLRDLFGNARPVPYLVIHGGADELVPASGPATWMREYEGAEGTFRYVFYPGRRHETSFPGTSYTWVLQWLGDLKPRERSPAWVTYRVVRDLFQPSFGITYDRAWWLSGIRLADGAPEGVVDARVGGARPRLVEVAGRVGSEYLDVLADRARHGAGGPPLPDRISDPLGLYVVRGLDAYLDRPPAPTSLELHLEGVGAVTVDTARMGWSPQARNVLWGETDRAAEVRLSGAFPAEVEVEGAPFRREGSDVVLVLPAGPFWVVVRPA